MLCMFSSDCVKTNIKWKVFWFLFFPHIFQKAATIWGIGFNTRIIWFVAFFFLQMNLTMALSLCLKGDSTAYQ